MKSGKINSILSINVAPLAETNREPLQQLVTALVRDDPKLFAASVDSDWVISGEDELHLELAGLRILERGIAAVGHVRIRYLEAIRQPAEAEGKYIRQAGGRGNYGHCKIRVEPSELDFEFATEIKGGIVPERFFAPIENGIREAAKGGILARLRSDRDQGDAD
jgi:elongation factor G